MEVTLYKFDGVYDVRTVTDDKGETWFVAKDVCAALEIQTNNLITYLDEDERMTLHYRVIGDPVRRGNPNALLVSEPGLYALIGKSRKEEAKAFRRWINHEVLPSIRKHGAYATDEVLDNMLADPANASKVFQALADEKERRKLAEAKAIQLNDENNDLSRENLDMQPKASAYESLTEDCQKFKFSNLARESKVGHKDLQTILVDGGLLKYTKNDYQGHFIPTDYALGAGLAEMGVSSFGKPSPNAYHFTTKGRAMCDRLIAGWKAQQQKAA
ncbi:BRO family protein [Pseudodesulfovibrio indicus]|uniref:BRO-N domain-containing protein n=1 Tax=Pseudodesulfovibrio indicus TaxID=1716143 RepID=UPI00292DDE83|nr:BRO family protein [Pseudodesulfovibrio indicus]